MALFSETDEKVWKDKYDAFQSRGKGKTVHLLISKYLAFVAHLYLNIQSECLIDMMIPSDGLW